MKEKNNLKNKNVRFNLNEIDNIEMADEKLNSALKFVSDELKSDPKILLQSQSNIQPNSRLIQSEYKQMFAEVEKVIKSEGWLKAKSKKDAEKSL